VQAILDTPDKAQELYPAAKVEPRGRLYWFLTSQGSVKV
jgi:hypothetical protein